MTSRTKTNTITGTKTPATLRRITKAEERKLRACLVEALGKPDADGGWSHEVFSRKIGALDYSYCSFEDVDQEYEHPANDPFDLAHQRELFRSFPFLLFQRTQTSGRLFFA